jgi:hypothetical protein
MAFAGCRNEARPANSAEPSSGSKSIERIAVNVVLVGQIAFGEDAIHLGSSVVEVERVSSPMLSELTGRPVLGPDVLG